MDGSVHGGMNTRDYSLFENPYLIPFRRSDLKRLPFFSSIIDQKQFINAINLRNFVDGQIFAHMAYPHSSEEFLFRVVPGPCDGSEVTFSLPEGSVQSFEDFLCKGMVIDSGRSVIMMQADPVLTTPDTLTVRLRKTGVIYHTRRSARYVCRNVNARICHGDFEYAGMLYEFNPAGLRIELIGIAWIPSGSEADAGPITVELTRDGRQVFSGSSRLIRTENQGRTIVLEPLNTPRKLYSERKNRNPRLNLVPSPEVKFTHPLTGTDVSYDIVDINSSGFSVMVETDSSQLMPGMIIEEASIEFAGGLSLKCPVRIVYGEKRKKHSTRYGFLITDIDVQSYNRLFGVVSRADDPYARVSYDVDMSSLWNFFFESGFIYPEKYTGIARYKDDFKETYRKLYHQCPDIFASLTYQRNGVIYGHVSLIKAYERSWMVNHLAAKDMGMKMTGYQVLSQVLNYFDSITRMPSIGMDYIIIYFPPENHFPNDFFGGVYRALNDPSHLSMDMFAYLTLDLSGQIPALPRGWAIRECTPRDLRDLHAAYRQHSSGILADALCLDGPRTFGESIGVTYGKYGLQRVCRTFTILHDGVPHAYLVADRSDPGMHLSELINGIKVIVPRESSIPWYVLHAALGECAREYGADSVPVQVFPSEYIERAGIPYKKRHVMWVLDTRYLHSNIDVIKTMARSTSANYLKGVLGSFMRGR
ncbi:MAG TPA: hypothetical protein PLT09_05975 [Deltaproteobacteria bacterium]|nr:hypothetical protein [Deltaproteobacteria bacterium]HPR56036.1 hypothetical protein [Deltaproteobacteria bacterium]HXK46967.1 hypothetical protein [Deltaproteobacteria bacterium]